MSTSEIGKARIPLPVVLEQHTGKGDCINRTDQNFSESKTSTKREHRKVKAPEDIDSDYAEEAEDFFYGGGM